MKTNIDLEEEFEYLDEYQGLTNVKEDPFEEYLAAKLGDVEFTLDNLEWNTGWGDIPPLTLAEYHSAKLAYLVARYHFRKYKGHNPDSIDKMVKRILESDLFH